MRIVLISMHFAEYAARLALELARHHAIQLHLSRDNASAELSAQINSALHSSLDLRLHSRVTRKKSITQGVRLARQVRSFHPDIIHAQEAGDWALAIARVLTLKIPFVYTVHDPRPHSGNDQLVATRNRHPRAFLRSNADAIIVHGRSIIPAMVAATPASKDKVSIVPHGLLGEALPPPDVICDGFVFFGRIEAYKGLDVLLDAFAILAAQGQKIKLHIVGRGPELERERERIQASSDITLTESYIPPDEVAGLLRAARAIILPYRDATQSGVASNAFAAGVPVIASQVGALVDVLEDETNAILVPPGNVSSLAKAILRVATDDALAKRLADGAYATAVSKLAWSEIAKQTVKIYEGIAEKSGAGRDKMANINREKVAN